MGQVLKAVYEEGVFKPLEKPDLAEHQKVVIELRAVLRTEADVERELQAWAGVYDGLSDEEIAEVEAIALDRSNFMAREADV